MKITTVTSTHTWTTSHRQKSESMKLTMLRSLCCCQMTSTGEAKMGGGTVFVRTQCPQEVLDEVRLRGQLMVKKTRRTITEKP